MGKALIVSDKQKILLRDEHPTRITTVIPTSKIINYKGVDLVVVPHEIDEVKVLNNMGYDLPSPVSHYYKWSGRYTPFHAQKVTVDKLTLNPRMFVLNQIGCVDSETEVLTPVGWVKISEWYGQPVAQYWPKTGEAEFVENPEYVKLPCEDMYRFKTKYGIDQMLSPEHRVLLQACGNSEKIDVQTADEVYHRQKVWESGRKVRKSTQKIGFQQAAIPVVFSAPGRGGVGLSDAELRVQIAVIADGHFANKSNTCTMRLKKERKKLRIRRLLSDAGISFRETTPTIGTAVGFSVFSFPAPLRVKEFDSGFWECSRHQLGVVCDEVMHWDGSVSSTKPTERFSSFLKSTADFVQYAYVSTGRVARLLTYTRERRGKTEVEYTVQVRANGKPLLMTGASGGVRKGAVTPCKSTDGFKYCFRVPSTFLVFRRNGCVFLSGNTGKSISTLWAFDYLRNKGRVKRMLMVTPLSTMERVWADEMFMHFPHLVAQVLYGPAKKRVAQLEFPADVYIINHDGIKVPEIHAALMARDDIDIVVVDEIAAFRNAGTERFKMLKKLSDKREFMWGLTGTPTPNSPTDAWAQCRLVVPHKVPQYFGKFRDSVERKVSQFKWVPRDNALEVVRDAMQPAVLFRRDECIDLPPTTYTSRHVELSPDQTKAYKQMMNSLVAEAKSGQITAVNEAVKAARLLQICSGVGYDQEGNCVSFDARNRLEVVDEIVEEAGGKVIVFIPLLGALESVKEFLEKRWQVEVVHGGVSKNERDRIFSDFQNPNGLCQVLVAHPRCMSHGLTLVQSNTIVWFIPTYDNETYEQANGRITRPGQKQNTFIIHIEGSEIERRAYKKLQHKGKVQGALLDLIKEEIEK